ncbi:hypothetical protein ACJRO7_021319 [Eucalyptus globulus]|uniref:O-methyltransferase C-terminal domain-containing protein n=1 Tax=Eucalyptus globulus TaxID=34317 RepID=A0ABD3KNY2_EUCGL
MLPTWSDEDCVKVLKKCKEAIDDKNNEQGKVTLIDIVISKTEDNAQETAERLFLAVVTGKEWIGKEWEKLFFEIDFRPYKITPMFGLKSLIVFT